MTQRGDGAAAASGLRIGICHPDLGIGGAERLIVDATLELQACGHHVHVFTAHHDRDHCFEETTKDSFFVTVYGSFLPRSIFNRFHAVCAYFRCLFVALCMIILWPTFDVVIVDQVSVVIPILRLKRHTKILFYCHFPDLLLAQHNTRARRLYRAPINWVEESTTGMADHILVNSNFTATTFANTFKRLHAKGVRPSVLYPAVDLQQFIDLPQSVKLDGLSSDMGIVFSLNRFERKKNISLAVSAFALLLKKIKSSTLVNRDGNPMSAVKLVVAGGYDKRLPENVEYLSELKYLATELQIRDNVIFQPSISNTVKRALLGSCICLVYTPSEEHFGIVPIEAMASGKAVVACNSGGPKESIINSETGFLCEPTAASFASAMQELVMDVAKADAMGRFAREHVQKKFSRQAFGSNLNNTIQEILLHPKML